MKTILKYRAEIKEAKHLQYIDLYNFVESESKYASDMSSKHCPKLCL